jgi:hypothetical protein
VSGWCSSLKRVPIRFLPRERSEPPVSSPGGEATLGEVLRSSGGGPACSAGPTVEHRLGGPHQAVAGITPCRPPAVVGLGEDPPPPFGVLPPTRRPWRASLEGETDRSSPCSPGGKSQPPATCRQPEREPRSRETAGRLFHLAPTSLNGRAQRASRFLPRERSDVGGGAAKQRRGSCLLCWTHGRAPTRWSSPGDHRNHTLPAAGCWLLAVVGLGEDPPPPFGVLPPTRRPWRASLEGETDRSSLCSPGGKSQPPATCRQPEREPRSRETTGRLFHPPPTSLNGRAQRALQITVEA